MFTKAEKFTLGRPKLILLLILSIGLILCSFLTAETNLRNFLTVDIPLADNLGLPIPVLFWLGIFIYLVLASNLFKANLNNLLGSGLILGFLMHFILLLLNISARNTRAEIVWYSSAYLLYFKVLLSFALCLLSVWSGILTRLYYSTKNANFIILRYVIGLFFLYTSSIVLSQHDYLLFSGMIGLFLLTLFICGQEAVYLKIKNSLVLLSKTIFNQKVFLLSIFIVAMVFRIFFLTRVMSNPDYYQTGSDGGYYDYLANRYLAGEVFSLPQNKGYWLFLAGIYHLFGRNYFLVGLIQSLFGSLAIVMIYLIAKKAFGVVAARITAIVAALDYPLVFSAVAIGHQAMDIFYSVTIIYLLLKCQDAGISRKGILLLALTGVISGLAIVNREVNVLIPLVAGGWLIYVFLKSGYQRLKIAGAICLFLIFSALAIGPFLYSNYTEAGSVYDQSSTYGVKWIFTQLNPPLTNIGFNPFVDFQGSLKVISEKPLIFLKAVWMNYSEKFKDLYLNQAYGGFDPIFLVRKPTTNYYLSMWFYAYLLTFMGMVSVFINRLSRMVKDRSMAYLALAVILCKTAFHLASVGHYRYRAPIDLFLIMFGAYGLYLLIYFASNSRRVTADG